MMRMMTYCILLAQMAEPSIGSRVMDSLRALGFFPSLLVLFVLLSFAGIILVNRHVFGRVRKTSKQTEDTIKVMEHALKIGNDNIVRLDLRTNYIIKLYGHMLPDEGLSYDDAVLHVAPEDRERFEAFIQQLRDGVVESADCSYRWNFDYSGGRPRWGYVCNQAIAERANAYGGPTSIISTLVNDTDAIERQQEEEDMMKKYRLIFENSIVGLSFYDPSGQLLDANKPMREICNFDSDAGDEFFSNVNLFDMPPFRDNVDKNNVEEFWVCAKSDIPERDMHVYLEVRLHPIRDDVGQLVYIAVAARDVTEERNLYLQAKLNDIQMQKANEEIQRYETELQYLMDVCDMRVWRTSFAERKIWFFKGLSAYEKEMTFDEYQSYFIDDDGTIARNFNDPAKYFSEPVGYQCRMRPVFHASEELQWNQINSIPIFDDDGNVTGCFGLIRNITPLMKKQDQLKRETERANDSGRLKSVFLANMTHEIRTPLNAIVGFSDLLQAIESPDEKGEMIRIIHNNCDMLLRLINDILVLSNVDANAMQILPEDVDFAVQFDDICQSLSQRVTEPAVEFQKDNPYSALKTQLDVGRIQQVITNFATNAVKYTHQGHIRLGYRVEKRVSSLPDVYGAEPVDGLYVYCEDTGTGIPKDKCEKVFERFVKLNDFIQGTGLGLSICKAIVEKCGGYIAVDSELEKGSTFWFWIPCRIAHADPPVNYPPL